ncbi:hypothetical protein JS531_03760 [Bifidobacterium sp. CP2]|uniref:hypothetical protein n=1 Tax=Bifidobacterium sp. CP2 TaxID=2809025 RepID=UPI001BDDB555|nr:hypothetical protein [Bifidobacterium sp. CP2]MBT1181099.1 hypothetical protein [Bifidobacterium sp. CP2]
MRRPNGRLLDNPLSQGNVAARLVANRTEQWLAGPGAVDRVASAYAAGWMLWDYTHGRLIGWQSGPNDVYGVTRHWRHVIFTMPSAESENAMVATAVGQLAVDHLLPFGADIAASMAMGDEEARRNAERRIVLQPPDGPDMMPLTVRAVQLLQWADATVGAMRFVDVPLLMANAAAARVALAEFTFREYRGLICESVPGAGMSPYPPACPPGWTPPVNRSAHGPNSPMNGPMNRSVYRGGVR